MTRSRHPAHLAVALGVFLVAGCGDGSPEASGGATVDTLPSGVIQVSNTTQGTWADGEGWQLVEEVSIGRADGDGPDLFGSIVDLEVDDRGRVFVLDNQARELRIFGSDGTHERTVGGEGGGPGEFALPVGLTIEPGTGHAWVVDPSNGRYTVFDRNGELVTTHPRPIGYFAWPWRTGFDQNGDLWDVVPDGLVRMTTDLAPSDTIPLPEYEASQINVTDGDGLLQMSVAPPYAPLQRWRFDANGHLWIAVSNAQRFTRTRLGSADADRIVRREHTPVPVTRAEADSAREDRMEIASHAGPGATLQGELTVPDVKPAFETFVVDDGGRLWVEPSRPAGEEQRHLLVFDPDGVYLGAVEIPDGMQLVSVLPAFRGDTMWAVVTDELDIQHVVRYRIERVP